MDGLFIGAGIAFAGWCIRDGMQSIAHFMRSFRISINK